MYTVTTEIINDADTIKTNGGQGFLLVLILLALFLHLRLAFWVALSIPIAFGGMFILASFFGVTINVISLFKWKFEQMAAFF